MIASSWPWMKGVKAALVNPTPPINKYDERPSVKELIEKHREAIGDVRQGLSDDPLFDTSKHDDLWILRFVLSHKKKSKRAIQAAKDCLIFRNKYQLDKEDIRAYPPQTKGFTKSESFNEYRQYLTTDSFLVCIPDEQLGVICFVKYTGIDQHKLSQACDDGVYSGTYRYISEWTHQWVDYITRTTGRLTKSTRFVDTQGISMKHISYENHHRDARAMGSMEDFYPQLLHCIYICNPPSWVQIPWRVIRALAPKRVVSKVDFIDPRHNKHDLKKILAFISLEHLPTQFGGKNEIWPASFPLPSDEMSETFSGSESDISLVASESQCQCRAALLYRGSLEMEESLI